HSLHTTAVRRASSPLLPYATLFRSDLNTEAVRLVAVRFDEQQRHAAPAGDQIVDLEVELLPVVPGRETPEQGSIFRADLCSGRTDRKSTRLNSSHVKSSYAVFCLTK